MPLTTALFTGLSGLTANQTSLDVIGNNIANTNTIAFKSSRALFEPQAYETYSFGTPPGTIAGGSNPTQTGLGATISAIQRNFTGGNVTVTGVTGDMAIQGEGMFIVQDNERVYTRNGSFVLNAENDLVTADGKYLMGYGVDDAFNVTTGQLGQLSVPLGRMTTASATSNVFLGGSLRSDGEYATDGTIIETQAVNIGGGVIDGTTLLTSLNDASGQVYASGTTLTFQGQRGQRLQAVKTLAITGATTVQEFLDLIVGGFGINTDPTLTPPGGATIASLGGGDYAIRIAGNYGTENSLAIGTGGLISSAGAGNIIFTETQVANGESLYTSMTVYDSLGSPLELNVTLVLDSADNAGTTWRFFTNSPADTDQTTALGTGTVTFDTLGAYAGSTGATLTIDRMNTGAITPLTIQLNLTNMQGLTVTNSTASLLFQDGTMAGTLTDYSIADDGQIIGTFSNGMTRTLGQVALATFANYGGLVDTGGNYFSTGPNSGEAVVSAPQEGGAGNIIGAALETSNVDISGEFINMIIASTGFSAASRVITTANQLLTELLGTVR